jgi:glycosyltransferase involved in cell wall biosynthesis
MKIGLDVTQALKKEGRGISRYIQAVVPELKNASPSTSWKLCIRGSRWSRRGMLADWAPSAELTWLPVPSLMTVRGLDLFHSFGNHLPAVCSVPRTFTIHDFRALDRAKEENVTGGRLRRNIACADGILCLTEHGKNRLLNYCPKYAGKVAVVPHGVNHGLFKPQGLEVIEAIRTKYSFTRPFLLQLGSWFPHKNLELSLRAFSKSRALQEGMHLVFVGGGAPTDYQEFLRDLVRTLDLADSVHWIEQVPENDLPGLLSTAQCLLQPSRYEGFALPILEAMATGIPGVVSDASCLPEVSAGIWPAVSLEDVEGFALAMDAMSLDEALREKVAVAGLRHAAGFTWSQTAEKTRAFFKTVLV